MNSNIYDLSGEYLYMTSEFQQRYITARRKLIESDFSFLNPEQMKAVMCVQGPLLLLAGAGSGKTTVLINRIANLIRYGVASESDYVPENATETELKIMEAGVSEQSRFLAAVEPVEPWRILAITFTNKAAGELKQRLERTIGKAAEEIWAQTFHSACVRILRRDAERLGYSRNFTIYDTNDSASIVKKIIKDQNIDEKMFPYRYVLSAISSAKDNMVSPEEFKNQAKQSYDIRKGKVAEIYVEYARCLRDADAMDFDDLILNAVRLLQENEDIREYYQRKFKYVLVDEYQDTNHLQYLLASTLAGGYENICVVGDDDQSIYKFRGATIENIRSFEQQYCDSKVIRLEQNYRSTGHILDAANAVIKNNHNRMGKNLWTDKEPGEKITLHVAANEGEEARFIADRIIEKYEKGISWSSNAILYRMNAQSNQLEYAFKRQGIPYRIYGGMKFFDRAEVKDMLAYLCVLSNPMDDLRLTRIINVPARGIGTASVETAAKLAERENCPIFEVLKKANEFPELQRANIKLRQFTVLIEELRTFSESHPLDELYDEIMERTGYIKVLQDKNIQENETRIENVKELKSNILSFIQETGDPSLHGFLDEVALYTDLDNMDSNTDCVVMMTMHSAKGLEFPTVFLAGAEEGIFPGLKAIGEHEEMEEERRLCYVAITRAMKKLFITCAQQRMIYGRTSANRVSRFVEEIPEEHIERGYIPKGYRFSDMPNGIDNRKKQRDILKSNSIRPVITSATKQSSEMDYHKGDMVEHKSFGKGMIISMTPMGGDYLVEIAFNNVGTKRLMLKAASRLMKKC